VHTYDIIWLNFSHNNSCLDRFVEKIKTQFLAPKLSSEIPAVYEMKWENMVEPKRPRMAINHVTYPSHAVHITLETHTQYEILNVSHKNNDYAKSLNNNFFTKFPFFFVFTYNPIRNGK